MGAGMGLLTQMKEGIDVQAKTSFFHCSDKLLDGLSKEIDEVLGAVAAVEWKGDFVFDFAGASRLNQAGYNLAFRAEFESRGWDCQPTLSMHPRLAGDFQKGFVLVEVQFGNSATLYRDYYKFQYGLANGLLSLAVLIVPTRPSQFFPSRPSSVNNMAEYAVAKDCLTVLPINVPTMLVGLLPEN